MKHYDLVTLITKVGAAAKVASAVGEASTSGKLGGKLLGCWATDTGALNRVIVLRSHDDREALFAEREKTLRNGDPFGCGDLLTGLSLDAYAPFPGYEDVTTGAFGPLYEIRTYVMKQGGLTPTLQAWDAILPRRTEYSKLVIAMYSLDGPPRITHIWPYASFDQRASARAESVKAGAWPPVGAPDWLTSDMQSNIAFPMACSPLQ
jgi:hypothetical protein